MAGDGAYALIEELGELPSGWSWARLSELIDQDRGICYGIVQPGKHDPNGVPMVNSQDVVAGKVASLIEFRVSPELHKRYRRSTIQGGEILLTLVGANFGQVAIAPQQVSGFNCSRAVGILPVIESPKFVAWCLRSPLARHYMDNWANTTAQPTFNLKDVANLPIPFPLVSERTAIAHILGTLDDKIELNHRMNETLEAIARAMFKSWFIDFDPVRAKMNGEPPESICQRLGLTSDLLALFPDRFVDTAIGEIPEGWKLMPLDGIADYLNGLALQKFPPESEMEWLPVIKIAQLKKGDTNGADRASHNLKSEYVVNDGDVLFSWSGSLAVDVWCGGPGALNQHLFKVTSTNYPKWFYLYWTKHHLAHFQGIAAGKAVTMGHIQRKHLTQALCAVPQKILMDRLTGIMAPLLDKQIENRKESRTLAIVRDELLPKLLSGELNVPDAKPVFEIA